MKGRSARTATMALRFGLGGLLIAAGTIKLRSPALFATEIANYQLFPGLAPYLGATLPTVEMLVGAGLILFPQTWRRAAAALAFTLFGAFSIAVGSAYFRHINIACGCFGDASGPITALTLVRNLILLGGATALFRMERPRVQSMAPNPDLPATA
jgi:putative oxidoreductase